MNDQMLENGEITNCLLRSIWHMPDMCPGTKLFLHFFPSAALLIYHSAHSY